MADKLHQALEKQQVIDSYNNIFNSSDRLQEMPSYYTWVLKHLCAKKEGLLLDIATGLGSILIDSEKIGLKPIGIDISITAIRRLKEADPNSRALLGDGETLPFADSSFDYVTNLGSLEHFLDPTKGIREISRLLKDNGLAAIFVPNSYYLIDIIRNVLIKGYGPTHDQPIERFATKNEWGDLIKENGLQLEKIYPYNFLFPKNKTDWDFIKHKPKKIIASMFSFMIPVNLSYSFLYICRKAKN